MLLEIILVKHLSLGSPIRSYPVFLQTAYAGGEEGGLPPSGPMATLSCTVCPISPSGVDLQYVDFSQCLTFIRFLAPDFPHLPDVLADATRRHPDRTETHRGLDSTISTLTELLLVIFQTQVSHLMSAFSGGSWQQRQKTSANGTHQRRGAGNISGF